MEFKPTTSNVATSQLTAFNTSTLPSFTPTPNPSNALNLPKLPNKFTPNNNFIGGQKFQSPLNNLSLNKPPMNNPLTQSNTPLNPTAPLTAPVNVTQSTISQPAEQ